MQHLLKDRLEDLEAGKLETHPEGCGYKYINHMVLKQNPHAIRYERVFTRFSFSHWRKEFSPFGDTL